MKTIAIFLITVLTVCLFTPVAWSCDPEIVWWLHAISKASASAEVNTPAVFDAKASTFGEVPRGAYTGVPAIAAGSEVFQYGGIRLTALPQGTLSRSVHLGGADYWLCDGTNPRLVHLLAPVSWEGGFRDLFSGGQLSEIVLKSLVQKISENYPGFSDIVLIKEPWHSTDVREMLVRGDLGGGWTSIITLGAGNANRAASERPTTNIVGIVGVAAPPVSCSSSPICSDIRQRSSEIGELYCPSLCLRNAEIWFELVLNELRCWRMRGETPNPGSLKLLEVALDRSIKNFVAVENAGGPPVPDEVIFLRKNLWPTDDQQAYWDSILDRSPKTVQEIEALPGEIPNGVYQQQTDGAWNGHITHQEMENFLSK
jgi:hypothetical protein